MPDSPTPYDAALECLALLPKAPHGVPLPVLMKDLNLPRVASVKNLFDELADHGVYVEQLWDARQGCVVAAITEKDWELAKKIAGEYVERQGA